MGGDKELRSQDMINVLQRSQVVCKGSEYGGFNNGTSEKSHLIFRD